jgi:hypothetical protein
MKPSISEDEVLSDTLQVEFKQAGMANATERVILFGTWEEWIVFCTYQR